MKKIFPCIIGLGYVGLPVFISLKRKFKVVGYDINKSRVKDLNNAIDKNKEFKKQDLIIKKNCLISSNENDISQCNFYIVTVPTPIKKNKLPNLNHIKSAFNMISKYVKDNDIIFLESTVYPGTTLDICRNIIKKKNKNIRFHIGYSSERINPGDKIHNIKNISKVVSIDSNHVTKSRVKKVYSCISRKIIFSKKIHEAELSKLIENTQRDLNIALMNEIMILCKRAKLDFNEVVKLANTKWNFLKFKPGLVGGHCLPVDPYYLSYFADKLNFNTKVTLAGRETNNSMENFIFQKISAKIKKIINFKKKNITILGLTYKPNVSDLRNSLAINIYKKLKNKFSNVNAYDPIIEKEIAYQNNIYVNFNKIKNSDIFISLVNHKEIVKVLSFAKKNKKIIIDPFS